MGVPSESHPPPSSHRFRTQLPRSKTLKKFWLVWVPYSFQPSGAGPGTFFCLVQFSEEAEEVSLFEYPPKMSGNPHKLLCQKTAILRIADPCWLDIWIRIQDFQKSLDPNTGFFTENYMKCLDLCFIFKYLLVWRTYFSSREKKKWRWKSLKMLSLIFF